MKPVTDLDDYLADLLPPQATTAAAPAAASTPPPFKPVVTAAGSEHISDDEFEALLDELHGTGSAPSGATVVAEPEPSVSPPAAPSAAAAKTEISDDEFESLLDELHGKGAPPAMLAPEPPAPALAPAPAPPVAAVMPIEPGQVASSPFAMQAMNEAAGGQSAGTERRRRAADRTSTWLRFSVGEQSFAVEVLKVQEVLRVPDILPLRGAGKAMIGLMNLRGQIVPVLDLAIRLGLGRHALTEASRVIVLEENGDTLGLLVRSVADVLALSEASIEHLNGPLALDGDDITCGIARRERSLTVLLDARRLLA